MTTRTFSLLTLFLTAFSFLAPVHEVRANDADLRIQLTASPDVRGVKGKAKYRDRSNEQEFQVEVEAPRRTAGAVLVVTVDDVAVGEMVINAFGKGRLSLNSKRGDDVPVIVSGSLVGVWSEEGILVLSGSF